jgi:homoserine O-acetyltransferase
LLQFGSSNEVRADGEQKFAEFDNCPLASGDAIPDCRIAYRTYGTLHADGSNAILFPTWYGGTTEDFIDFGYIGPGLFADTDQYFVIAVDAFGNGVSSSPSNSQSRPGADFPQLRIQDMVIAEHRLLTETLDIHHLRAVIGISMGGMQTFEWLVRYPYFMDKAVSVVGTPRQTSYDLLLWNAQLDAIRNLADDDYESTVRLVAALNNLTINTPAYFASTTPPSGLHDYMEKSVASFRQHGLLNYVPQLQAMIHHDISASFDGSMQRAADAVRADVLIVISPEDHMVNPAPSREFADLSGATIRELAGRCGHIAMSCDKEALTKMVLEFLRQHGRQK